MQNKVSCSPQEIVEQEGLAELGGTEAVVLGSLSTQIRSCIATCGGGGGAAARGDCWRYLFGFVTIWLGEQHICSSTCDKVMDPAMIALGSPKGLSLAP